MIVVHSVGPYLGIEVYWGIEYEIPVHDKTRISRAWLVEDLEPYRRSIRGIRVRFGDRGLHLGTCKRGKDPYRRGVASVGEISDWKGPHVQAPDDFVHEYGAEPYDEVLPRGSLHSDRGEPGGGDAPARELPLDPVSGEGQGVVPAHVAVANGHGRFAGSPD